MNLINFSAERVEVVAEGFSSVKLNVYGVDSQEILPDIPTDEIVKSIVGFGDATELLNHIGLDNVVALLSRQEILSAWVRKYGVVAMLDEIPTRDIRNYLATMVASDDN